MTAAAPTTTKPNVMLLSMAITFGRPLVAGPFAGGYEPEIVAALLLGFAVGWVC